MRLAELTSAGLEALRERRRSRCGRSARSSRTARTRRSGPTRSSRSGCASAPPRGSTIRPRSCCRRCRSASRATARPSPARSGSPRRRCARSCSTSPRAVEQQGFRRLVIVNNHFEPEQVATLRAAAADAGALLPRPRAPPQRAAAHRRVPPRLLPRGALRDVARARRRARSWSTPRRRTLPANEVDMPAAMAAGRTDFVAMGMDRAYCGAPARGHRRGGPRDVRDADRHARRARPGGGVGGALQPRRAGSSTATSRRGAATARRCCAASGAVTYAELAALVNRAGHVLRDLGVRQEERVLLALSDGVEFVATWYAAQKIGAVTAEVYTFLPAKDFAYYLDYTRAGVVVVDATTLDRVREARASWATGPGRARCSRWACAGRAARGRGELRRARRRTRRPRSTRRRPTPDDIAIWKFTTGSTGMPKACVHRAADAAAQLRALRARRARHPRGRRRAAGAEAVLRLRARPGRAVPVRRRRRRDRLPGALDARADLRARRPPPADDPRQRADDDPRDARAARRRTCRACGCAPRPARRCRRSCTAAGSTASASRCSTASARPRPTTSTSPTGRARARPGTLGQVVPGYTARVVDEDGSELPDGETGRLWIEGDTAALMYWQRAREVRARPTRATWS